MRFTFSGASKFTDEASRAGHVLISRITKLHYNWEAYPFLRPDNEAVVNRYNKKFRPKVYEKHQKMQAAAASASGSSGKKKL